MADIKKELKLTAVLDDSKLRSQIQQLKKELGSSLSLNASDLQGMEKSFSKIADQFSAKISKAISAMKTQETKTGGKTIGGKDTFEKEQDAQWRETAKRLQKEEKERIKIERKVEAERRQSEVRLGQLRERRMQEQIEASQQARMSPAARYGNALRGMAPGLAAGGAAILGAGYGLTALRSQYAERQNRQSEDVGSGRALESLARRSGRSEFMPKAVGGLGGALAGAGAGALAGSLLGPVGTLAGGAIGGIAGGIGGAMGLSNAQGEMRVEQIRPLLSAVSRAQGMTPGRISSMRGGGLNSNILNGLQGNGAQAGFTPEETINQAIQARSSLGNKALPGLLGSFQNTFNQTGIGVGEQAAGAEAFAGSGNTSRIQGAQQQIDLIRKGVAMGLDASKSGQLLKETSQFLSETTGLGRTDTGEITDRMVQLAAGFAGGKDITDTSLRQARELSERQKAESRSTSGVSGIGNVAGTMEALGDNASPGQMLAALNLSSTATVEDAMAAGLDEETARKLIANKKGNHKRGLDLTAGSDVSLRAGIGSLDRGIATEEEINAERASGAPRVGVGASLDGEAILQGNQKQLESTKEFQLTQEQAKFAQEQVVAGFENFRFAMGETQDAFSKLNTVLENSAKRLEDMVTAVGLKVEAGN